MAVLLFVVLGARGRARDRGLRAQPAVRRRGLRHAAALRHAGRGDQRAGRRREPGAGGRDAGRGRDRLRDDRRTPAARRWACWRRRWPARALNAIFAWLVIDRRANQLATGLALMFCRRRAERAAGRALRGPTRSPASPSYPCPGWPAFPCSGPRSSPTTRSCTSPCPLALATRWVLFSTRWGLALRAVGENPVAAFAAGRNPRARCSTRRCCSPARWAASPAPICRSAWPRRGRSG